MRRGLLALVAALAALVAIVAAGPASGTDYRAYPPKLDLYKEGPADRAVFLQHTRPQAFAWHTYSRKTGRWSLTQGSGVMGWPVADKVGAKKIVFFRMDSRHAPTTVEIKSYNNPDMRGKPIYLKPGWVAVTNSSGKVVSWDILFKLEKPHRQHYLTVHVYWKHRPGHHDSYGWTEAHAHLKAY